jgi:hypothetical protein
MAIGRGAALVASLSACGPSPSYPPEVKAWLSQAKLFCAERSAMSHQMCRHFMTKGAKIATLAFRNGHDREARICVEDNKRQNGGYLDLASAGECMIRAGVF